MIKERLIRIYTVKAQATESKAFRMVVNKQYKKVLGILFSSDVALSLSLSNETELELNSFEYTTTEETMLAPDKRKLTWEQKLNVGETTTGRITNLKQEERIINVYLIIEQQC